MNTSVIRTNTPVQKYILLTNIYLENYSGSVLNCLSIAKALKCMGFQVEVATFKFSDPIRKHFLEAGIDVKVLPNSKLSRTHYDIIWAHHSITLDYLLFSQKITADRIIASSLSSFSAHECLPFYANDLSICLANSEETRQAAITENTIPEKVIVFPNYVDNEWFDYIRTNEKSTQLKKIAIVSNHVPQELLAAVSLLKEKGIATDIYGNGYKFVLIEPKILSQYDLVISIGKTVQFSMALSVPVYCYDHFGGPGYLTCETLEKAAYYNFSGRGFDQKSADELCKDIIERYEDSLKMLPILLDYVKTNCSLETNIKNVLRLLNSCPVLDCEKLTKDYAQCARHNKALVDLYFKYNNMKKTASWKITQPLRDAKKWVSKLKSKIK